MSQASTTIHEVPNSPFSLSEGYAAGSASLTESFDTGLNVLPGWLRDALARLAQLERLSPDWDGYGGLPVGRIHANRAQRFLEQFMSDQIPMPDIVPLADGGVQLEWHFGAGGRIDFVTDSDEPSPSVLVEGPEGDLEIYRVHDIASAALGEAIEARRTDLVSRI